MNRTAVGIAFAAVVVLLLSGTGRADPRDDARRVDRQLAETRATLEAATDRARQAAAEHAAAKAALPGAENALADARGRLIGAESAARQAQRDADAAKQAEAAATAAYRSAAGEVERSRASVTEFVSAAYRGSGFMMVNSILRAGSPSEMATRVAYLDHVAADQRRALDIVTQARMLAKQHSDAALLARQEADRADRAAARALEASRAAAQTAEQAAATVRGLIDQTARAEAITSQERNGVLARYNELKAESERIAAELRAAAARNRGRGGAGAAGAPVLRPGATFLMPVSGWKSSNFGMRFDPFFRVWQLHAGVDLAAGGGSPIYAAAEGQVVRRGWAGGYGNYTCLYHGEHNGEGLGTCYAHQSQMLVSVGQHVQRGQLIGRVGTTGASTGYHLHFEVRLDGRPVDPLRWLPGCLC